MSTWDVVMRYGRGRKEKQSKLILLPEYRAIISSKYSENMKYLCYMGAAI